MPIAARRPTVDNGHMTTGSPLPAAQNRPLPRRSAERKIAGVAGGLSDAYGVDPSIIRIGFALLGLASGAGLVVYLGAWLLMLPPDPVAGPGPLTASDQESMSDRPTPALIFGGVLLGAGLLVGLMTLGGFAVVPASIIGLVFFGIVLLNRTSPATREVLDSGGFGPLQTPLGPPASAAPTPATPVAPTPGTPPPSSPLGPTPSESADPHRSWPPPGEPGPAAAPAPVEPEQAGPEGTEQDQSKPEQGNPDNPVAAEAEPGPEDDPQDITDRYLDNDINELRAELAGANFLDLADTGTEFGPQTLAGQSVELQDDLPGDQERSHWAITRTEGETTLAAAEADNRPEPPLATLTLAALGLLTGIGLVFNTLIGKTVSAVTLAGAGTAIVGFAVVFSAFAGRTRRLVPIAIGSLIVLAFSPVVEFAARDGIGSSEIRVSALESLDDEYRVGIGYLGLRLDDLVIEEDTVIEAGVGIGSLEITVPADAVVEIRAATKAGYIYLLDRERSGLDQSFTRIPGGRGTADEPRLIIDAENTIGEIEVVRARGN